MSFIATDKYELHCKTFALHLLTDYTGKNKTYKVYMCINSGTQMKFLSQMGTDLKSIEVNEADFSGLHFSP